MEKPFSPLALPTDRPVNQRPEQRNDTIKHDRSYHGGAVEKCPPRLRPKLWDRDEKLIAAALGRNQSFRR
jgi:hypothetical protein